MTENEITERRISMYDMSRLKGKIVEKFGTQGAFAQAVNRTAAFISNVLCGKAYLEQREIAKWADALGIPIEELHLYFFANKVHE